MGLTIRLRKAGKISKKRKSFRIVACDSRCARDGRFIEELGFYDPCKNPADIKLNKERVDYWMRQGAKVSPNVLSIIKRGQMETQVADSHDTSQEHNL